MATKSTKGLRIATPCATVEQFIAAFHRYCEESSFFVSTLSLRPVGIETAFSVDLNNGQSVLRGFGVVLDAWPTAANRFGRPGVRIGVHELTTDTKPVFEQLLIARAVADSEPKPKRNQTRQIWAIKIPGVPALGTPSPIDLDAVPVTEAAVPPTLPNAAPPMMEQPRVARPRSTATPPSIPIIRPKPTPVAMPIATPPIPSIIAKPAAVPSLRPIIEDSAAIALPPPPVIAPPPIPPPPILEEPAVIVAPPPPPILDEPAVIVARPIVDESPVIASQPFEPAPVTAIIAVARPIRAASRWRLALVIAGVFGVGVGVGVPVGMQVSSRELAQPAPPPVVMSVTAPIVARDAGPSIAIVAPDAAPSIAVVVPDAAPIAVADAAPAPVVVAADPPPSPVTKPTPKPAAKPPLRPHPKRPRPSPAKCVGLSCI